jgi:hypothetical protein
VPSLSLTTRQVANKLWKETVDMTDSEKKIGEQMRTTLEKFTGPVTKYPAGKPRAKKVKFAKRDDADRWLNRHRNDVVIEDERSKRRRLRIERAQRERIAERNALVRKRIGEVKGEAIS